MKHRQCSLLIVVLVGFVIPIYSLSHNVIEVFTVQRQIVQEAYQELRNARNFDEMNRVVEQWKHVMSFINQHQLLHHCWEHITSTVPVEMTIDDINRGDTHHDLNIEGGRCAWLFEQFTACQLPAVTRQSPQEELAQARSMAFDELITLSVKERELQLLLVKAALPLNQKERLALAQESTTPEIVLNALADDREVTVRLAVARNVYTGIHALSKLAHYDSDAAVRKAGLKNLESARIGDLNAKKIDEIAHVLSTHPLRTLTISQTQPIILPFDLAIEELLTTVSSAWRSVLSVKADRAGPQTLIEAVKVLVKTLNLPAPPVFCTEDESMYYCSASTSLEPGTNLISGFAIRKGDTTIYSWGTSHE